MTDRLLTTTEAADLLRVGRRTLESWRLRGGGPPYHRVGGAVRYRLTTLEQWLAERERSSTSDRPEPQAVA